MYNFWNFRKYDPPPNLKHLWPKQLICLSERKLPQVLFYSPLIIKFEFLPLLGNLKKIEFFYSSEGGMYPLSVI